ncbi:ABC transporter permease subunit [Paenibacillus sp. CAU 1782]
MSRAVSAAAVAAALFAFVFIIAMMPIVLQSGGEGQAALRWSWSEGFQSLRNYITGLSNGESFQFYLGKNQFDFRDMIGRHFMISFFYVAAAAVLGTVIGLMSGIFFGSSRRGWLQGIVDFTGSIPEFVIILILQFSVVFVLKQTGVLLFEVATLNSDEPAVVLPLIAMVIIPAGYLIRNVSMQMKLTLMEDYIGTAKARGLKKSYILFYHALPNVLPYIKGDLHKLMGIIMGNLFIVEYLMNNKGISQFIFAAAFSSWGYQYSVVVNGLLSFLALYGIGYWILRGFLYGLGRVFAR